MKFKTRAVLSIIFTIIIGIIGVSSYMTSGYMTFFGIELSIGWFLVLLTALIIYDIVLIKNATKNENQLTVNMADVQTQAITSTPLEKPSKVSITRLSSMVGAAMGVRTFLNGTEVGVLKNNQTLDLSTNVAENDITVQYIADGTTNSIKFNAESDGVIRISLKYSGAKLTIMQ